MGQDRESGARANEFGVVFLSDCSDLLDLLDGKFFAVENYLEAVGVMAAFKVCKGRK